MDGTRAFSFVECSVHPKLPCSFVSSPLQLGNACDAAAKRFVARFGVVCTVQRSRAYFFSRARARCMQVG